MDKLRVIGISPWYDDQIGICGFGTPSLSLKDRIGIDFFSKPKLLTFGYVEPANLRRASREALAAIKGASHHLSEIKTLGFKVPLYAPSSDCLASLTGLRNLHITLDREPQYPGDEKTLRNIHILQKLPHLKRLEVELSQPLTQDEVVLLSSLRHLEELIIKEAVFTVAPDGAATFTVDHIVDLPKLRVFFYESNGEPVGFQARNLPRFEQLDSVTICCSRITNDLVDRLAHIQDLDTLRLKCEKPIESLHSLRRSKNLRFLDLHGAGAQAVESLDTPQLLRLKVTPQDLVRVRPQNLKLPVTCEIIYPDDGSDCVHREWLQSQYPGRTINCEQRTFEQYQEYVR